MAYVNNLRVFVRVYELGSMSSAARDQRVSPAVASSRISELEKHLGVRLFNRTTRSLQPTEHGTAFYAGALKVLDAITDAEAAVANLTNQPRGSLFVSAPLGVGKRFIAPHIPAFKDEYREVDVLEPSRSTDCRVPARPLRLPKLHCTKRNAPKRRRPHREQT